MIEFKQIIGRGTRLYDGKNYFTIIDFVDDLSSDEWTNYLMRHAIERRRIYKEQKFEYVIKKIKFDGDI